MWGDLGRTAIRFWPLPTCSAPPLPFFLAVFALLCFQCATHLHIPFSPVPLIAIF